MSVWDVLSSVAGVAGFCLSLWLVIHSALKNRVKLAIGFPHYAIIQGEANKESLVAYFEAIVSNTSSSLVRGYKTYVGQEALVFSSIQGWAEIYKIHGSIEDPGSMILTDADYQRFEDKSPYLAAKLLTIFMEHPIIFMGYSVSDPNIQMILKAILECLSNENLQKLQDRFIYVSWDPACEEIEITPFNITVSDKTLAMTRIRTSDFLSIYREMAKKRAALPVKLLRMFKQEFYTFALTNQPTAHMRVASIDDERVEDDELVLAIGKASEFGLRGIKGLTSEEWYRNIVLGDLLREFTVEQLLINGYPPIVSRNNYVPVWRLLREAGKGRDDYPEYTERIAQSYDAVLNASIIKYREGRRIPRRGVKHILEDNGSEGVKKSMQDIAYLYEDEIDIDELEEFLVQCFTTPGFYSSQKPQTYINRLVRIFDWIKYGAEQRKSPKGQ